MLGHKDAMATIAVRDMEVARKFYTETLGLTPQGSAEEGVLAFQSGNTPVVVYASAHAGTNQATSVTWALGADFDSVLKALQAKGVRFEHYELPGLSRQGDVHVAGSFKAAWFKDPDGNILHILNH